MGNDTPALRPTGQTPTHQDIEQTPNQSGLASNPTLAGAAHSLAEAMYSTQEQQGFPLVRPICLRPLPQLTVLNLSETNLEEIGSIDAPNLIKLNLSNKGLKQIAAINLPNLKVLNLSHNLLKHVPYINSNKLRQLDLRHNNFSTYPNCVDKEATDCTVFLGCNTLNPRVLKLINLQIQLKRENPECPGPKFSLEETPPSQDFGLEQNAITIPSFRKRFGFKLRDPR